LLRDNEGKGANLVPFPGLFFPDQFTAALTAYTLLRIVQVRHSSLGIFGKVAFYFRWWMIFNWAAY
jgi:hypothetical protein